jgi:hypothetical protein
MNTPIPTPETDAAAGTLTGVNLCAAFETKCRQLEMERNEARILARDWREKWSNDTKRETPPETVYPFSWENVKSAGTDASEKNL